MRSAYNSKNFSTSEDFKINEVFIIDENNTLHEVPSDEYTFVKYTKVSLQFNYVQVNGMYYVVPFDYINDSLTAYISDQYTKIHGGGVIPCIYERLTGHFGQYRTE